MPPGVELDQGAVGDAGETWFTLCTVKALKECLGKTCSTGSSNPSFGKALRAFQGSTMSPSYRAPLLPKLIYGAVAPR